jgi:uncharacterized coiled-coil DUF342 family protein
MTDFQLFINELTRFPLNYLKQVGCSISEADFTSFNSYKTDSKYIENRFAQFNEEAKKYGSARMQLIEYVVKAICNWRESAYDIDKFTQNRDKLEKSMGELLANLSLLLETSNSNSIEIDSEQLGHYSLIGLKPSWTKASRGNIAITSFFETIKPIYKQQEDVKAILDDHYNFFEKLANKSSDTKAEIPQPNKELEETQLALKSLQQEYQQLKELNEQLRTQQEASANTSKALPSQLGLLKDTTKPSSESQKPTVTMSKWL